MTPYYRFNHKARGVNVNIADTDAVDDVSAELWATALIEKLIGSLSVVGLALSLFEGDALAADRYVGIGVSASVKGVYDFPVFAAVRMRASNEGLEIGARTDDGTIFSILASDDAEMSSWSVEHYPSFCTPLALASCTAEKRLGSIYDRHTHSKPAAVRLEAYARLANDAASCNTYLNAGDLRGHVVLNASNAICLRTRTLLVNLHRAAINASTYFAEVEKVGGELPRLDATYYVPENCSLHDAVSFALKDALGLFSNGLVSTPLRPLLRYMGSVTSGLVGLQYAALQAVDIKSAPPFASLSNETYLASLSACLRSFATGRWPGRGAPSPALCIALGKPPAGLLAPAPIMIKHILGLEETTEGSGCVLLQHSATVPQHSADLIAARWNEAAKQLYSRVFECHFISADGKRCEEVFTNSTALHNHIHQCSHQAPPRSDLGFLRNTVSGFDIIEQELRQLSQQQRRSIHTAIATGRNVMIAGQAGVGKTWTTRALVAIARRLLGNDAVLWITPTHASKSNTGDPDAMTLHAAGGFKLPGSSDSVQTLVRGSISNSEVTSRLRNCKVIVMDEAQMMPSRELLAFFKLLSLSREHNEFGPTGLCQIIIVGDVGQLLDWSWKKLDTRVKSEVPSGLWIKSEIGERLEPLVFELTEVRRQESAEFVKALQAVRRDGRWERETYPYSYFEKHCSVKVANDRAAISSGSTSSSYERPTDLIRRLASGNEVPTLAAVREGYVTLVATHAQELEINELLRKEAQDDCVRCGREWHEITINAVDYMKRPGDGSISGSRILPAAKDDTGGAPPELKIHVGMTVSVAHIVHDAISDAGTVVDLAPGCRGKVLSFKGSTLHDIEVTVQFDPSNLLRIPVTHCFKAVEVVGAILATGVLPCRKMVQLRYGACMTFHSAMSLGFFKLIVDCSKLSGDWSSGLMYTGVSRAIYVDNLIFANINEAGPHIFCNNIEMDWVTQKAAETSDSLITDELHTSTPIVTRDVAAFLAKFLRSSDAAALAATAMTQSSGHEQANMAALLAIDDEETQKCAVRAGEKRSRRYAVTQRGRGRSSSGRGRKGSRRPRKADRQLRVQSSDSGSCSSYFSDVKSATRRSRSTSSSKKCAGRIHVIDSCDEDIAV